MSDRQTGRVKWFNIQKGFGFIIPDDGGKDVFVHINAVEQSGMSEIREGERVEYSLKEFKGRMSAADLRAA